MPLGNPAIHSKDSRTMQVHSSTHQLAEPVLPARKLLKYDILHKGPSHLGTVRAARNVSSEISGSGVYYSRDPKSILCHVCLLHLSDMLFPSSPRKPYLKARTCCWSSTFPKTCATRRPEPKYPSSRSLDSWIPLLSPSRLRP